MNHRLYFRKVSKKNFSFLLDAIFSIKLDAEGSFSLASFFSRFLSKFKTKSSSHRKVRVSIYSKINCNKLYSFCYGRSDVSRRKKLDQFIGLKSWTIQNKHWCLVAFCQNSFNLPLYTCKKMRIKGWTKERSPNEKKIILTKTMDKIIIELKITWHSING